MMTTEQSEGGGELRCKECRTLIAAGQDHEVTEDGVFCRHCYDALRQQIVEVVSSQMRNVNYPMAFVLGLAGAAAGVVAWWGFTVLTEIAFGFVAIVIGLAVGKGVIFGSGGKRSRGLQIMSVAISTVAFFYASYLVTRSFVLGAMAESGEPIVLPWLPDLHLFYTVVSLNFGVMELVFLAIVLYAAWRLPAPIRLGG